MGLHSVPAIGADLRSRLCVPFLFFALLCFREASASDDCPTFRLRAEDQSRLEAEAIKSAGSAPDRGLTFVCRGVGRYRDYVSAWLQTPRVPQPDGGVRWQGVTCQSFRYGRSAWDCQVTPYRGLHLKPYAEIPGVWVEIEKGESLVLARRLAEQAFSMIEGQGEVPACSPDTGKPMAFADLKTRLTDGDGTVSLEGSEGGISLSHGQFALNFELDKGPDAALRVRCWLEFEVVVTSQR
jgi:hypothetical protein